MALPSEIIAKKYGHVVEGPQGLLLPESTARLIESKSRNLPKDFTYRRLAKNASVEELPEGERTDKSFITTDAVDRDGEVVLPSGGDLSTYNKVVTFAHKYDQLPAGSNWWIRPAMKGRLNGLMAKTHYPDKPADWGDSMAWLPSAVLHMMQQPVPTCTGKSIGFLPTNIRQATNEEKSARPEWANKPIIDKWLMLEYAVAPVPANGQSEMVAVSRMLKGAHLDTKTMEVFMSAFNLKDMADGDGLAMHLMKCPMGHGPAQLVLHSAGAIYCKKCMKEYKDEDMQGGDEGGEQEDALTGDEEMSDGEKAWKGASGTALNPATYARAMGLAKKGNHSAATWEPPAPADRDEKDCLGINRGSNIPPAQKLTHPIIANGTLMKAAVSQHAAAEEGNPIGKACKRIMAACMGSDGGKAARLEAALAAPFYDPSTMSAYESAEARRWAKEATTQAFLDALAVVSGKV